MRRLEQAIGTMFFWLTWPALWLYLRHGERTRVVIEYDGRIMVVKALLGTGKWQLPGGGLHKGEDPLRGAMREVLEETGLNLRADQLTALNRQRVSRTTVQGLSYAYYAYGAQLDEEPVLSPQRTEISEIGWIAQADIDERIVSKDVLAIVAQWSDKH